MCTHICCKLLLPVVSSTIIKYANQAALCKMVSWSGIENRFVFMIEAAVSTRYTTHV